VSAQASTGDPAGNELYDQLAHGEVTPPSVPFVACTQSHVWLNPLSSARSPSCWNCADADVRGHVAAAAERWLELLEHEENFPLVGTCVVGGLNLRWACLAGVGTAREIIPRTYVAMVETEARRFRHERDPLHAVSWIIGAAFFRYFIDLARNQQAMSMGKLGGVRVVPDIDGDDLTFL